MIISAYAQQNSWYGTSSKVSAGYGGKSQFSGVYGDEDTVQNGGSSRTKARMELLDQLRSLKKSQDQGNQNEVLSSQTIVDSLFGENDDKTDDKVTNSSSNYNFRSVSNKIQQAKTSASAAKAVLSAKRKVQELKRKLANTDGDTSDIEFALNHAKAIERVAKKKKVHLEQEELAERTSSRDEVLKSFRDGGRNLNGVADAEREKLADELSDKEAEFDKKQTEMYSEAVRQMRAERAEISDEIIEELDAMIDDLTESEGEMLKQAQEMLDAMDFMDPHMTPEQLERVKLKHRSAERRDIIKADADYFKSVMKHQQEMKGSSMSGFSGGYSSAGFQPFSVAIDMTSAPAASDLAMSSFDAQA